MKALKVLLLCVVVSGAFGAGFFVGSAISELHFRAAVVSGPHSDDFEPALAALEVGSAKIRSGDTNVMGELDTNAQRWTKEFLTQLTGATNAAPTGRVNH